MANVNTKIEDMVTNLSDIFNYGQVDDPSDETTFDGKTNPKYNSDVVYMFGGIINQIVWSMQNKKKYADQAQQAWIQEKENNPDNPSVNIQIRHEQSLGAMENLHALYEFNVMCFNTFTGWTWNDGKSTKDYGMKWFAEHKDRISDTRNYRTVVSAEGKKANLLAKLKEQKVKAK